MVTEKIDAIEMINAWVKNYYHILLKAIEYLVDDQFLMQEVTQDTFIEAWQNIGIIENPKSWLIRTARANAIDALRKQIKQRQREEPTEYEDLKDMAVHTDEYFAEEPIWFLNLLKREDAEILHFRYGRELTLIEIGQELGLSPSAVKMRLKRALERASKNADIQEYRKE